MDWPGGYFLRNSPKPATAPHIAKRGEMSLLSISEWIDKLYELAGIVNQVKAFNLGLPTESTGAERDAGEGIALARILSSLSAIRTLRKREAFFN